MGHHVCLGSDLACSGVNPCRQCKDAYDRAVLFEAMNRMRQYVLETRGPHGAVSVAELVDPNQFWAVFYGFHEGAWKTLHQNMMQDPEVHRRAFDTSRIPAEVFAEHARPPVFAHMPASGHQAHHGAPAGATPTTYGVPPSSSYEPWPAAAAGTEVQGFGPAAATADALPPLVPLGAAPFMSVPQASTPAPHVPVHVPVHVAAHVAAAAVAPVVLGSVMEARPTDTQPQRHAPSASSMEGGAEPAFAFTAPLKAERPAAETSPQRQLVATGGGGGGGGGGGVSGTDVGLATAAAVTLTADIIAAGATPLAEGEGEAVLNGAPS